MHTCSPIVWEVEGEYLKASLGYIVSLRKKSRLHKTPLGEKPIYLLALSLLAMAFMPILSNLDPMFSSNRWPNLKEKKKEG